MFVVSIGTVAYWFSLHNLCRVLITIVTIRGSK